MIKHLFKIQDILSLYQRQKYNDFLKRTEFKIRSIDDKRKLKTVIDHLSDMSNTEIGTVIDKADELGICRKDDKLEIFISKNSYVYDRVKKIKFSEFQNLYSYLEATHHSLHSTK